MLAACALAGCTQSASDPLTFGGNRPVKLELPAMYDPAKHYPLVIVLHGYGSTGEMQSNYVNAGSLTASGQAFVLAPDGKTDSQRLQFWNADPVCCDFDHTNPDDVGYLGGLIDQVSAAFPVDPNARFIVGHSNGGYMAYRMACERADVVTNIVVLAGGAASMPAACNPRRPVEVLHIHGTADDAVPFDPTANSSATQWAQHDGCAATRTAGADQSLVVGLPTHTQTTDGCPTGIAVDLWTITGGGHVPDFGDGFFTTIYPYLLAHRRPS